MASLKTHDEAEGRCFSYLMALYNLDTPETQKALLDFSNSRFKESSGRLMHVYGKTSAGCSVIYNGNGLFEIYSDFCNSRYYFYCQYFRKPKVNEPGND
jgi:hypothetical protein